MADNVAALLTETAKQHPDQMGVAVAIGRLKNGRREYQSLTFRELDDDSTRIATGLLDYGYRPGMRVALMVKPGIDFISLVFALFKAGLVTILIDPGMGRRNLLNCLQQVEPEGFIGIPLAQAVRTVMRRRFPKARLNVTVGRRWFWGGATLRQIRTRGSSDAVMAEVDGQDPAAIIFTTGSTGPPKGVLYRHQNFFRQAIEIRDQYQIQPQEIDLPGFPLFALFNAAMAVSTVIPVMDFTRPANVDPLEIISPIQQWSVTQAFGSPALWNRVGRYCEEHQIQLPTLRRVLSAGAPVPPHVIRRVRAAVAEDGDIYTPYGATESLPVASIDGRTVLEETEAKSKEGAGTCVGSRFPGIEWKVIAIDDGPLMQASECRELTAGEIGELMVRGPVVTTEYVGNDDANKLHKVNDEDGTFWHRMGDVGYLDGSDRFWFCGRKNHRVRLAKETMYTIPCEAIFNQHPAVYRSALVGIGDQPQVPVLIAECWPEKKPTSDAARKLLLEELAQLGKQRELTSQIEHYLLHDGLPVDIRHNSKIFREKLRDWAAARLPSAPRGG